MNVPALVAVGAMLAVALIAALLTHAAHINARPAEVAAAAHVARHAAREAIEAVVVDPLTERELALGQLDHGAESFAVHTDIFRTDHDAQRDEHARQVWNAGFDWYIDHLNKRFDAIVADLPTTGEDPFPASYWPVVSAVPMSCPPVTLDRLAHFSPDATIQIINARNAEATWFSWSTAPQALIPGDVQIAHDGDRILVRERPRRSLRYIGRHH